MTGADDDLVTPRPRAGALAGNQHRRVRRAEDADAGPLAALEQVLFGPDAWDRAALLAAVEGPDSRVSVVAGASPAGYVLARRSGDVVELLRLGVAPEHRPRGLGTRLLEAVLQLAPEVPVTGPSERVDRVLLEVSAANRASLRFYAAAGFSEVDRRPRYYADGSDAVVLRRSLARGWD